jgi:hypothetical protein
MGKQHSCLRRKLKRTGTCSRRWRRAAGQRRLQSREQSGAGGGRERGFSQGPFCKTEETQGLYGKLIFPTIQRSNERMPKTKVVELFKPYNIVLGLKFKNPKLAALQVEFRTKVKFKLPCPYPKRIWSKIWTYIKVFMTVMMTSILAV